jgi:Tol biopolymer transport system component
LVVVDGQPGPDYDVIFMPEFSPDGKHVAYVAKRGEKLLVVVDGQSGVEYDGLNIGAPSFVRKGDPHFRPDDVLEYLAARDNSLYRLKYIPVP